MSTATPSPTFDHGQRRQELVARLVTEICEGRLSAGDRLVTNQLSQRFGVSHTPIREALIGLAGVGLVDLLPNRGAIVRQVTRDDVREILEVRRALECEAVRQACGRADAALLRQLDHRLTRLESAAPEELSSVVREARDIDSELHDSIADWCGNEFLRRELRRLNIMFRAFRDVAWRHYCARNDLARVAEEARQHRAIISALLNRNRRAAVRTMSRHILSGVKYWSRALEETKTESRSA